MPHHYHLLSKHLDIKSLHAKFSNMLCKLYNVLTFFQIQKQHIFWCSSTSLYSYDMVPSSSSASVKLQHTSVHSFRTPLCLLSYSIQSVHSFQTPLCLLSYSIQSVTVPSNSSVSKLQITCLLNEKDCVRL